MASGNQPLVAFNRGLISPLGISRIDLKRQSLSAEIQTNWIPRTLGSMMLRPGWQYMGATNNSNYALWVPFIFSLSDTALVELTDQVMRFWVDETPVSRVSVSTAITNGGFDTDISGWTTADESGAASTSLTGYLVLTGTGFNKAITYQQITVSGGDNLKRHALRVIINRGPVVIRVGSSLGGDDLINAITLNTGIHSLALTPNGNFYVQFENSNNYASLVDSCQVESSGVMTIPTTWDTDDLPNVRYIQSGDEIFCACAGQIQRIIQRWATDSWSYVTYQCPDGPFQDINITKIQLTPSAITGDISLTASEPIFKGGNANAVSGSLYRITSNGQIVSSSLGGGDQFSDPVLVTGLSANAGRQMHINIGGTWSGTLRVQRSVGEVGSWVDVLSYSGNAADTYSDGYDNQSIYYRIGFVSGEYTSGSASVSLSFPQGGIDGIVMCTGVVSSTQIDARVIQSLGSTTPVTTWSEGQWSDRRGWPTCCAFHEGRLWWAGQDLIFGSVSDAFSSFDDTVVGDSGPIIRSIGSGPVDSIQWMLSLIRLQVGGQMTDFSAMSSTLDEPLTPTNFNLKGPSTQGSAPVQAVKVDQNAVFIQRSGTRIMGLEYDIYTYQYIAQELSVYCPEVGEPGVVRMAVQRKPDTRIHCIRSDGQVAVLIYDKVEEVSCFVLVETEGGVEDVIILPGNIEDKVYYSVQRQVNSSTVRYLEKWAQESECRGGNVCKLGDAHVIYSGSATGTLSGLSHLEGKTVVVWGDGIDQGSYTVSGGAITLANSVTVSNAMIGLPYTAQYQSTKLAYFARDITALTMPKKVNKLGLILAYTHAQGLQFGKDFNNLDPLTQKYEGANVDLTSTFVSYDGAPISFPGSWNTDARVCLQANAPRPVTVLGIVVDMDTNG